MEQDFLTINRTLNDNGETILTFLFNGLTSIVKEINGLKHGKCFSYFPSTNDGEPIISAIYTFVDDILHGKYFIYSLKGNLLEEGFYNNGKIHGNQISYRSTALSTDENKIRRVVEYKSGIIDGNDILFYPNGQICSQRKYVNGKLNGKSVRYKSNGDLSAICYYQENLLIGDYISYINNTIIDKKHYKIINNMSIGCDQNNVIKFQIIDYELDVKQWHKFFIYEDVVTDDDDFMEFIKNKDSFVTFYTFLKENDMLNLIIL